MITAERLRQRVNYDPETGIFTRLVQGRGQNSAPGSQFGTVNGRGYLIGMIDRKIYLLHRLAWFWVHGEWPAAIDHADGDKANNRIANLRPATGSQNEANKPKRPGCMVPLKGVTIEAGRYRASIKIDGKAINLGRYDTAEEAHQVYIERARLHHGAFARAQ